jgi:hypothetical protein
MPKIKCVRSKRADDSTSNTARRTILNMFFDNFGYIFAPIFPKFEDIEYD